jgi:acyl-coenzyme A synthetase/AMP-(fatty) acid ligase
MAVLDGVLVQHEAFRCGFVAAVFLREDTQLADTALSRLAERAGCTPVMSAAPSTAASPSRYEVPREVYIEETLPKNAVGKTAKPVLRERLKDAGSPIPESGSSK